MGTLPRLFALAGVLGFAVSQETFRMIQQTPVWFEVGQPAEVLCQWEQNFVSLGNQVVEWKTKESGIKKITRNSTVGTFVYKNSPITEDRLDVTVDWEGYESPVDRTLTVQSSTLHFTDYKVTDPQNYTCEVEISQEQHSARSRIIPYAVATLTMHDDEITTDLRKPVETVQPTFPSLEPDANGTDTFDMTGEDTDLDETMSARKRRQVSSDATLDENPVTDGNDTKYISVYCIIEGAYPKLTDIEFIIGETDKMNPSEAVEWTQDEETKLFSGRAVLEMVADPIYDGKAVSCSANLPTQPVQPLVSSNVSNPFIILHDATKVTTEISPEVAVEGDDVMIECRGDGNPAPTFSVKSDDPDNVFDGDATGTQFTITSVSRNQRGYYWCEARSVDRSNPEVENTVESDNRPFLQVQYIDTPTLSSGDITRSKGQSVQVECQAEGNPPPSMSWNKNGMSFSSGSTLNLPSLEYDNAGQYECVAMNHAGSRSASLTINVEGQCNIVFEEPTVTSSQYTENTYSITLTCITNGNPECQVNIVPPNGFDAEAEPPIRSGGSVTLKYRSVPMLSAPVKFTCIAENAHTPRYNRTVTVGEPTIACCREPQKGGISTGAIVGILLLVLVVIIGIPVACYCVKKRNAPSTKKAPTDAEAGPAEKEGLHKEASSEDSDTGSLPPPPPTDDTDPRMNSSHEMKTFSTNQ